MITLLYSKAKRMTYEEVTDTSEESKETSQKHKFITIWKAGQLEPDNDKELKKVGPENFKALMKLG